MQAAQATGSTNSDKAFSPGERIEFCDEHYTVVGNHGRSGTVSDPAGCQISPFYWQFEGVDCHRIG